MGSIIKKRRKSRLLQLQRTPAEKANVLKSPRVRGSTIQVPYMKGTLSRSNAICTPTSSFTPTKKKFLAMQKIREEKLNKSNKAHKDHKIDPADISTMFDRRMESIDKFPQKLLLNLVNKNCIALRVGYGTVVRFFGIITTLEN